MEARAQAVTSPGTPAEAPQAIPIPAFFADAFELTATPFAIHLALASTLPGGAVAPRGLVTVSPELARSLAALLVAAADRSDELRQPRG